MDQLWKVVNIDRRERYQGSYEGGLGQWFFRDHDELLEMLREKTPITLPGNMKKRLAEGKRAIQPAKLFALPVEVLDMIFEELSFATRDPALFYFAITCKALCDIAERRIVKFYQELFLTWRDCRVICVGIYLEEDDELPAGVLTEAERAWVASQRERLGNCYQIFMEKFTDELQERQRNFNPSSGVCAMLEPEAWGPHGYTSKERGPFGADVNMLRELYGYKPISVSSFADREVLCNTSKREYVRDLALYDPEIPMCITLAQALIALICWSSVAGYTLDYEIQAVSDMKRGRWAGDRFRVVTEDALPDLVDGEWTDISEEVGEVLRHLVRENAVRLRWADGW
ncbi:hypothetical protein C8Q73DRAFT_320194 [Cubamyces lactineus]|nr:hypothetical protein C8Q73DRAFT_320194 [Cubamyces lactineus]